MSKRVIESTEDGTEKNRQTKQSYQPVWMARWMRPSSKDINPVSTFEKGSETSLSVKEPLVSETKAEAETPRMSSKSLANELSNSMEYKGRSQTPEILDVMEKSFKQYHFVGEDNSKKNPPATLMSFLGSSAEVMQYHSLEKSKSDKGKALMTRLLGRPPIVSKNQFPNTRLRIRDQENCRSPRVLDMETMKICTTVDTIQATAGGPSRFSQTTHSLFFTKGADVDILKEDNVFRSPSDVHNLPPYYGQANRGVKIQPLYSSSTSEGLGTATDLGVGGSNAATKNESSADTDTMDKAYLKKGRSISVANYSHSTKGFKFGSNLSPKFNVATSQEVVHPWKSTGLPDMNIEPTALPAPENSLDNTAPISSRTQSLEMDVLLSPAEQPTSKYSKADPTYRWLKRLKRSTSDSSGRATKITNTVENSSHDDKRAFFFFKNRFPSSEPPAQQILDKNLCRDIVSSDRSQTLSKENEESKELLSHAWIKRWMRNGSQTSQKMPEPIVVCEPLSSKMSIDDLRKKQFPSIAAMALVGRTMKGHRSYEVQKRGSYSVWNTKAF